MLDNDERGAIRAERPGDLLRGGEIEDVVVRELLAMELPESVQERAVEGSRLVRVLAVAEEERPRKGKLEAIGERRGLRAGIAGGGRRARIQAAGEEAGDRRVVGRGPPEGLEPSLLRRAAVVAPPCAHISWRTSPYCAGEETTVTCS